MNSISSHQLLTTNHSLVNLRPPDQTVTAEFSGQRVVVLGLGSFGGGVGAVRFLSAAGAFVTVCDQKPADALEGSLRQIANCPNVSLRLGGHSESDVAGADLVVASTALRPDHPLLRHVRSLGIPITSEIALFVERCRGRLLCVTGSNGKSTTTAMLHHILARSGRRTWLGGNIGKSLLPDVYQIQPTDDVVLELSSFQLSDLDRIQFRPQVAVVTNLTPNHLDWHDSLDNYRAAKQTIVRWQQADDVAVLNADDPDVRDWPTQARRVYFGAGELPGDGLSLCDTNWPFAKWLKVPGRHNQMNAAAASLAAMAVGINRTDIESALRTYQALPHRLEFVGELYGRHCYNDSIATTPESTIVALESFPQPIILLAGGYNKGIDLTAMAHAAASRAKAIVLMGQTGPAILKAIQERGDPTPAAVPTKSFPEALAAAWQLSAPGDVILLSPGCASYDWFRNFEDRGQQFRDWVRQSQQQQQQ